MKFVDLFYRMVFFQPLLHGYRIRCPDMIELFHLKSRLCTNSKEYHCMAENSLESENFTMQCRNKEWISKGYYPVTRGRYIDYQECQPNSYQPFGPYWSNERYKCSYAKSTCSEEGQIVCNHGNTTHDRTCRCNHEAGYHYVVKPRDPCSCVPTIEDCSCFRNFTPNPDSICTDKNKCAKKNSSTDHTTISNVINTIVDVQLNQRLYIIIIAAFVMLFLIASCLFLLFIHDTSLPEADKYQDDSTIKEVQKPARVPEPIPAAKMEKNVSTHQKNTDAILPGIDNFQNIEETIHMMALEKSRIDGCEVTKSDPKTVPLEAEGAKNKTDILVMFLEKNSESNTFITHLNKIIGKCNFTSLVTVSTLCNTDQSLEDIMKECQYLFIYITGSFTSEELTSKGFRGEEIEKALMGHSAYHNIITVLGSNVRNKAGYRINIDYGNMKFVSQKDRDDNCRTLREWCPALK